jgi:hypothetical protein
MGEDARRHHRRLLHEGGMKKIVMALALGSLVFCASAFAQQVRDWHDLDAVHTEVVQAINDMQRARAANHYDMQGHGIKAEQALRNAERELRAAIAAAKQGH